MDELTGEAVAVVADVEIKPNPLPLLWRALVLPRSAFTRLAEEGAQAWPYALGLISFFAFAKAAFGGMLAWRGAVESSLLPAVAVRYAAGILGPVLFALFAAGVIRLTERFWDGDAPFRLTLSAVSLALMPLAVRDLIQVVYMAVQRNVLLHPGLSALVAPPSTAAVSRVSYAVLGPIDAFTVWAFVLLAVSMMVTHGRGWGRRLLVTFGIAILWVAIAAVPTLLISPLFVR